jgi:hypothetical protein
MMKNYLFETCRGWFKWNKLLRKVCILLVFLKLKHCSLCQGFQATVFWNFCLQMEKKAPYCGGSFRTDIEAQWHRTVLANGPSRLRSCFFVFDQNTKSSSSFRNVGAHKMTGDGYRPNLPSEVSPHTNTRTLQRHSRRSRNVSALCSYVLNTKRKFFIRTNWWRLATVIHSGFLMFVLH